MAPAPDTPIRTAAHLKRPGGALCLDFVNTATWTDMTLLREHLVDFEDVLQWADASDFADTHTARRSFEALGPAARGMERELADVKRLRLALRCLLTAQLTKEHDRDCCEVQAAADLLSAALRTCVAGATLVGPQLPLRWRPTDGSTAWLVGPVALDAAALLTGAGVFRVSSCEGDGCGWLFLDRSRSHPRRWCAMEPCGNRVKARAHADRRRSRRITVGGAPP